MADIEFALRIEQVGEGAFARQCIPTAPELLGLEAYKSFLAERRRAIANRLNEFLGTAPDGPAA